MYHYQIFGINIASELYLTGLDESDSTHPDLFIREGIVQATLENYEDRGVFYYAEPGKFLFEMDTVGRFIVTDGKEIVVEKYENAEDSDVILFLLGSVMGATILQRGLIPIHGSTIIRRDTTFTICGKSGAGKSSLAAEYIRQGSSLISDDISAIDVQDGNILVKKGIQHLKLWADSLRELQIDSSGLSRIRPSLEKYYMPCKDRSVPPDKELNAIIILEVKNSEGYTIQELNGIEKFEFIRSNIYRGIYIEPLGLNDKTFNTISEILRKIKVYRIVRPIAPLRIKELADFINSKLK